jgi:hypothetical protein
MYTPGYEDENKTKPELVLKIEESDPGLTPEKAAAGLYEGAVLVHSHFNGVTKSRVLRCSEVRIPHYGYVHRKSISNEHTRSIPIWFECSQGPHFWSHRYGTYSTVTWFAAALNDMNRVDWPHIVEERCGQASDTSQRGTFGISGVEKHISDGMTVFFPCHGILT